VHTSSPGYKTVRSHITLHPLPAANSTTNQTNII
jgi:hypothetical protein